MKRKLTATAMLLTTAVIWGAAVVAQVLGGEKVGAFTFNGFRFLLGALSMLPVCLILEREGTFTPDFRRARRRRTYRAGLACGAVLYAASALQQYGAVLTRDPAKIGFLTGLYTVLTPVLYLVFFRKRTPWNAWLGCALAALGLYLLFRRPGGAPEIGLGEILLLFDAALWACHILLVDRFVADVGPIRFSVCQFLVCGVLSLLTALLVDDIRWASLRAASGAILFAGVLSVGVAFTLQMLAQTRMRPTVTALLLSTESVFAALSGIAWNRMTPPRLHVEQGISPLGLVGCGVMFIGIVVSQLPAGGARRKAAILLPEDPRVPEP